MTIFETLKQIWELLRQLMETNHIAIFLLGSFMGHIVQAIVDHWWGEK